MSMKRYFVSYYWQSETQHGYGNTEVECTEISSLIDVQGIAKHLSDNIKDKKGGKIEAVVLNYILLPKPPTP